MRRKILLSLLAAAVLAMPAGFAIYVWFYKSDPDRLALAIEKLGFYPITPPTLLRNPGSIYHISRDGRWTSALCEAEPERLKRFTRVSSSQHFVSEELRKAKFGIGAAVGQNARSDAEAAILQTVVLKFEQVKVLEVSIEDLATLAGDLQKRESCQSAVVAYLEAGDYVCQVQTVLLASAAYDVTSEARAKGAATADAVVLDAIKATIDPTAQVTGNSKAAGENLYYGMKFAPRCLALRGQVPPRLPRKWHEKLRRQVGLFR